MAARRRPAAVAAAGRLRGQLGLARGEPGRSRGQANLGFMLDGLWATVTLSLAAMALSLALGLVVALAASRGGARCAGSTASGSNCSAPCRSWC